MSLIAIDVAILPPPEVTATAIRLSAALAGEDREALRLDADHLPHITLTQQFVRLDEVEEAIACVAGVLGDVAALTLRVTGGGGGESSVWMAIDRTPALAALHGRLMESLRGLERSGGGPTAFFDH